MKAAQFRYERPARLDEAIALMAGEDVAALAGGQSLMPMMNFRLAQPEVLVDLNGLDELRGIADQGSQIRIGAMTRYAELAQLDGLATRLPLVAAALPHVAHAAIRNRGTLGGSVALADPAAEMPAVLLALSAVIHVAGAEGARDIAADAFFHGLYETALEPGELVTAITLPTAGPEDRYGFREVARRHGDYAMAGVAIAGARIAFFAVADRPIRALAAEACLAEDPTALDAAVDALAEIPFAGDLNASEATKRHLAGVMLRRAWGDTQ